MWHRDARLDIGEERVLDGDGVAGNGKWERFLNHKVVFLWSEMPSNIQKSLRNIFFLIIPGIFMTIPD